MTISKSMKILVVDDSEINLLLSKKALSKLSDNIDTARSGREAVDLVEKNTYDLILMDIHMPEMDGYETTAAIRKSDFHGPIFALTASLDLSGDGHQPGNGLNDFIEKPFTASTIKERLDKFLAAH